MENNRLKEYQWKYYHWLYPPLPMVTIRKLKKMIDADKEFPCKVFFTGTWEPSALIKMDKAIYAEHGELRKKEEREKLDEWRTNQVKRFYVNLARQEGVHLKAYWALSPFWENEHFHALISSTEPIRKHHTRALWEHGQQTHFSKYDALYGKKHYDDEDRGCINYIFSKHHPVLNEKPLFHPNKKACRKGICEICNKEENNES